MGGDTGRESHQGDSGVRNESEQGGTEKKGSLKEEQTGTDLHADTFSDSPHLRLKLSRGRENIAISLKPCKQLNPHVSGVIRSVHNAISTCVEL